MQEHAGGGTAHRIDADDSALARELATARERLAFYEGFDRLIQENIARSGDLMREAIAQREASAREAARARAELDRRLDEQRATLSGLGEELVALQERTGVLARRVIAALDDLTEVPVFPAPVGALAGATPSPAPSAAVPSAVAASGGGAGAAALPSLGDTGATSNAAGTAAAPAAPAVFFPPRADVPTAASSAPSVAAAPLAPASDTAAVLAPEGGAVDGGSASAPEQPRSVAVVVHGVPRAAAALSLQRHLAALPAVEAVEAREYAGGVLRLQVQTRTPLAVDDLRGWEEGAGLEPVHVLPGVIEVALPGASGR